MHLRWLPWLLADGDTTDIKTNGLVPLVIHHFCFCLGSVVIFAGVVVSHRENGKPLNDRAILQIQKFVMCQEQDLKGNKFCPVL